jgi:predicted transcriptional regulator
VEIVLTDREADLMRVLWAYGPCIVAQVQARLDDPLAYTTVQTVLRTLEAKGYVGHKSSGRVHHYFAAVQEQDARKTALQRLKAKLFQGSTELLFAQLVSDRKLTAEQIARMRALLDGKAEKGKP